MKPLFMRVRGFGFPSKMFFFEDAGGLLYSKKKKRGLPLSLVVYMLLGCSFLHRSGGLDGYSLFCDAGFPLLRFLYLL